MSGSPHSRCRNREVEIGRRRLSAGQLARNQTARFAVRSHRPDDLAYAPHEKSWPVTRTAMTCRGRFAEAWRRSRRPLTNPKSMMSRPRHRNARWDGLVSHRKKIGIRNKKRLPSRRGEALCRAYERRQGAVSNSYAVMRIFRQRLVKRAFAGDATWPIY